MLNHVTRTAVKIHILPFAFLFSMISVGCGNPRADNPPRPQSAPTAANGKALVYGAVSVAPRSNCAIVGGQAHLAIQNRSSSLVFETVLTIPDQYRADIDAGDYVLTAQVLGTGCFFSQTFNVITQQSLAFDVVLQ